MQITIKPKTCKVCKARFTPVRAMQKVCGPMCALEAVRAKRLKAEKSAQAQDKRETKAKLVKMKTRGQWLAECKVVIQRFRRLEELAKGSGCMSCGRSQAEVIGTDPWRPGGYFDGGHFLGKGARPELALEPLNIWLQCKSCNAGSGKYTRKGHTVNQSFEANLIDRIGAKMVNWLKGPHELKHYTVDDLKAIKTEYAAKVKALKEPQ